MELCTILLLSHLNVSLLRTKAASESDFFPRKTSPEVCCFSFVLSLKLCSFFRKAPSHVISWSYKLSCGHRLTHQDRKAKKLCSAIKKASRTSGFGT